MRTSMLGLLTIAILAGCASSPSHETPEVKLTNREIALKVLNEGLNKGDIDVIKQYVAEDYIQHNPMAETGRAGLISFVNYLKQQPKDAGLSMKVVRSFEDGEFVVVHSDVQWNGRKAVIDVFRVRGGKLVEHWDAIQDHPETTASGHSMTDGATEVTDLDKTEANKQLVRKLMDEALVTGDYNKLPPYFDGDNCIQHSPMIADGVQALVNTFALLDQMGAKFQMEKCVRVIGQGNFVLAQSRGEPGGRNVVLYDLFRVENGKIAEIWDVLQEVPDEAKNKNGMLPD